MENIFNEILKTIFLKIFFSVWLVQKISDGKKQPSTFRKHRSGFQWQWLVSVSGCRQTSMVGNGLWQLVTNSSKLEQQRIMNCERECVQSLNSNVFSLTIIFSHTWYWKIGKTFYVETNRALRSICFRLC